MAEEFQESEIIFSDKNYFLQFDDMDRDTSNRSFCNHSSNKKKKKQRKKKSCSASVPVNIPSNVFKLSDSEDFEEDYDDGEEMVPPHLIIGRRIEGKMAYSVCTGNGRTLKGRDLSQVRNSILRLTGFLEA
ncbi:protein S40-1-like [Euphorbia lathyris]|uniref:protein S40-1-like n=1 Tax=Euphorbia lathyris TaxID=212925 RepID=UPI0033135A5D